MQSHPMSHAVRIVLFLFIALAACQSDESDELGRALKQAGKNRPELEKVLAHYRTSDDPRRLEAAEFLIRNMQYHRNYQSSDYDAYYAAMDSVNRLTPTRWKISREQDSLYQTLLRPQEQPGQWRWDTQVVDSAFLVSHIEEVFAAYDSSEWCRDIPFEDFCEYLLPYRVGHERIDSCWISYYRNLVHKRIRRVKLDSMAGFDRLQTILKRMHDNYHIEIEYDNIYEFGYRSCYLANLKKGTCTNYSELACLLFRSVGIPTCMDFTPLWANRSMGHDWNVLLVSPASVDTIGNLDYCFSAHTERPGFHVRNRKDRASKIYRQTFSPQRTSLALIHGDEPVPAYFEDAFMKDVSHLYGLTSTVSVKLSSEERDKRFYYLMTFDNRDWQPVAWTERRGDSLRFENVGKDLVCLIGKYDNGEMLPVSSPLFIHEDDTVESLTADKKAKQTVRVFRKYQKGDNIRRYSALLKGGRIEASNNRNFRNAVCLHAFTDSTSVNFQTIPLKADRAWQYYRFVADDGKYGGEIAEFELYNSESKAIKATPIGSPEYEKKHPLKDAFDGKVLTYAKTTAPDGGWCGLDCGRPVAVSKIKILPHNDDNFIRIGEEYELFYWDDLWVSLGRQQGTESQYLDFPDAPQGALFLLRNNTRGKEERIFLYQGGEQIWR